MISYEEQITVYKQMFHPFGIPFMMHVELLNLVGSLLLAARKKNPDMTVRELFDKLAKKDPVNISEEYITQFSVQLEVLLLDEYFFKPSTYGLKAAPEILARISEILQQYVPF